MGKIAVLAEKPSVGRDIARVLNCHKSGNKCLEGNKYVVTWALGHLVTLADPERYDSKYATWQLNDLPMLPKPLKLDVIKQTHGHYKAVSQVLNRKDIDAVVIATDAGREGELVARWILDNMHLKKPIKRLWISSVTDKAIQEGFKKLKNGHDYDLLYASAKARSEADWYVGMNATRALTCKFNAQLSCGRVQTPTLAMIARREAEIQNFKSKPFYGIEANANDITLIWEDDKHRKYDFEKERIEQIFKKCEQYPMIIEAIQKSNKQEYAPALYDLTELQRDANRLWGYSAKQTLSIMQKLYETHKVLTYPRTDSRYLTADIVPTLQERLRACGVGNHAKIASGLSRNPVKAHKRFVDDSKVSDHHAIIPTEQTVFPDDFSHEERKIYDLVIQRFLSVLMPPHEYEQTRVTARIGEEIFMAKGKRITHKGWQEIYDSESSGHDAFGSEEQHLPVLHKGDSLRINALKITEGETAPPPRFTEGTLLTAMEHPIKGSDVGIGTVATRADIIDKLLNTFLIEKRGNALFMTSKGNQLLELVPDDLKEASLTVSWEEQLSRIEKGSLSKDAFISEIIKFTKDTVRDIKNSEASFKHDNKTRETCPDCGKYLLQVNGKKGKMMVCEDRTCGYRKYTSRETNARCPNCHKKMNMVGEGDGKMFTCRCGYREKLSAFNERKKASDKQGNRKDVQKYLKEQQKEDDYVSPMAEILNKLNLDQK